MLVLLPPSEGKTAPVAGPQLDLAQLSLPGLGTARRSVLESLVELCRSDPRGALGVLRLSPRQGPEVQRNAGLHHAPSAPAWQVYTGVLFEALDLAGAPASSRARLVDWTLVWSGLWGAVRLTDPIPAYRLSGAVSLPGTGRLASFWRDPLARALSEVTEGHVVLDLRSGTYASSWTPPPERTVAVRVIHNSGGRRTVASHFNKATKGRLLRDLADARAEPRTPDELVTAIREVGYRAEPAHVASGSPGRPQHTVDVVVDTL